LGHQNGKAVLLIVALLFFVLMVDIDAYGRYDHAHKADVIIVLGARVNRNGQPGANLRRRIEQAWRLWHNGMAPNIITTGGFRHEPLSAAAVARRQLIAAGIPAEHVFLAEGSANTVQDAQVARLVMAEHGWKDAIVVTHPYHLLRAAWSFRLAGVKVYASPTSTAVAYIAYPTRIYYLAREAVGIIWTTVVFFPAVGHKLQTWLQPSVNWLKTVWPR